MTAPRVVEKIAAETNEVMLVDHNEFQQSVSDIEDLTILAVVDHHRIANFQTANPLYYRAEPVGCTSTIVLKLYKENNIAVPAKIAGIMLSAIISDTLLNLSTKSEAELLDLDAKSFPMADKTVRIAQVNTVDLDEVFARQDALRDAMLDENVKNGYDLFLLLVTNVLNSDSELLVAGEPREMVTEAFKVKLENDRAFLPGVVSRKKQIVPQLTEAFEK